MMKLGARADPRARARSVPRAGATGPRPMPARGVPPILLHALPRILIIRTGSTALEVQHGHGDYDRWFRDALAAHDLAFDLCDATKSAITDASPYAGIIVTGSVKSVLKPEPWMDRLSAPPRGAGHPGEPQPPLCFGRPMLARARGRVAEGHVDRLLEDLERFDPIPARRLLDNFVRLCRRDRSPDRMM